MDAERQWVEDLAVVERAHDAYLRLKSLPEQELRPLALRGLLHESWRVRRSCALLLDDLSLTDETIAALQRCLEDPHPKVRKAALHTVTCKHCKPDGCILDVQPVFERMASDPDRRVRKSVVGSLGWAHQDDPWAAALLRRFADGDPSAELRELAVRGMASIDRKRDATALLDALPPGLRTKVERHRNKWVAFDGGGVIAADQSHRSVLRAVRGAKKPDATLCWVP